MLEISVKKLLGQTRLDVSFVASGRSVALFGPSGSGKTSTLNMIAGLLQPDDGRVVFDSVTLFDKPIPAFAHKRASPPVEIITPGWSPFGMPLDLFDHLAGQRRHPFRARRWH
jgi:ABC-type lipopolysaccharide export system ATPase subunit